MARGGGSAERGQGRRCVRARAGPGGGSGGGDDERGRARSRYRPPPSPPLQGAGPLGAQGSRGAGGRRTGDPAALRPWGAGQRGPGARGRRLSAPSLLRSPRVRVPALPLRTHARSVATGVRPRFHALGGGNKEPL